MSEFLDALRAGVPGPVLRIHRFTATRDGMVCEFVQSAYRGDRYQLNVELR